MKRLLKRLGLWPSQCCRYYSKQVVRQFSLRQGSDPVNVHAAEMRIEKWVSFLGRRWRVRDELLHESW